MDLLKTDFGAGDRSWLAFQQDPDKERTNMPWGGIDQLVELIESVP
jgi:hypothetical protein